MTTSRLFKPVKLFPMNFEEMVFYHESQ